MDRRSLLALLNPSPRPAARVAPGAAPPSADVVYEAARQLRGRIDAALAASRLDDPPASASR